MKKILLLLAVFAGITFGSVASASLWDYYSEQGSVLPSIEQRADIYKNVGSDVYTGSKAQNEALEAYLRAGQDEEVFGATPTPTSSAAIQYVEAPDFFAYSPAVAGDTTITLNSLKDIYGNVLTMANFGAIGYGRIDPDGKNVSESFTFSGVTANSDGTYTLTGVKSALAKYPYTQTSGLVRSHSINAIVRFTNTAAFYDNFANKENNEIVDGQWVFSSSTGGSCWNDTNFCIRSNGTDLQWTEDGFTNTYNFTSSSISQLTASSTAGIGVTDSEIYINASSTTGMGFDSNGALYQAIGNALEYTNNAIGVSTSTIVEQIATSTPTADAIVKADGSGKIDEGFLNISDTDATDLTDGGETSLHTHSYSKKVQLFPGSTTVTNTTTETALVTTTLTGGELSTSNGVRIIIPITNLSTQVASSVITFRLKYGSTTISSIVVTSDAGGFAGGMKGKIEATLFANASTSSQRGVLLFDAKDSGLYVDGSNDTFSNVATGNSSEVSTGNLPISITAQWTAANSSNTITVYNGSIEIIK